jgi:hypothetical protein
VPSPPSISIRGVLQRTGFYDKLPANDIARPALQFAVREAGRGDAVARPPSEKQRHGQFFVTTLSLTNTLFVITFRYAGRLRMSLKG